MIHLPEGRPSRRTMLGLAGVGVTGLVLGGTAIAHAADSDLVVAAAGEPQPEGHHDVTTVRPDQLAPSQSEFSTLAACNSTVRLHSEIGNQPTYYEIGGAKSSFNYNPTFYSRLETWLSFFFANTPVSCARPARVWTYGAYLNRGDGCKSYHNFGRAFDISRIYATNPSTGALNKVFNARYDQWKSLTGSALTNTRRWYWATSASLHYHFKHVLTYRYNTQHHNHIHLDNSASGGGNSTFATAATAQVQHVQACLTYVWGRSVTIDGKWGPQTSAAVKAVLTRIGAAGSLTTQANWLAFNRTTTRFGSGAQSY